MKKKKKTGKKIINYFIFIIPDEFMWSKQKYF
jgi:hypothetical protein